MREVRRGAHVQEEGDADREAKDGRIRKLLDDWKVSLVSADLRAGWEGRKRIGENAPRQSTS